ncbi:XRE family transcriptional regulator [Mesorhizobium sp. AR10]|uniref:XRE family transcriptional regulator n=1 Tax=Mesorhizobium sp. AR10 TaxID=2865839 RepID=UPI00215EFFE7|nr:XRE family transcriptional regulator [Mesorhizobium sp. AR10]UVK40991.1 XRE family transcriptional regulator [Mesorhizobium sp. AR10]
MNNTSGYPNANNEIAKFIDRRIDQLKGRKSQKDVAVEAGFINTNILSMIKTGATKVPFDRVPGLAKALECDPARLFLLALEQYFESSALVAIKQIFGTVVSENEVSWIEALRKASDNTDPPLTAKRAKILRAIFGKIGPYPGQ